MERCIAAVGHDIPERPTIQIEAGEVVDVAERDGEWPAFVFVTTQSGSGWVPARHLSAASGSAIVLTGYDTTELPTAVGEVLEVVERDRDSGWTWCRNAAGREGWVPDRTLDIA